MGTSCRVRAHVISLSPNCVCVYVGKCTRKTCVQTYILHVMTMRVYVRRAPFFIHASTTLYATTEPNQPTLVCAPSLARNTPHQHHHRRGLHKHRLTQVVYLHVRARTHARMNMMSRFVHIPATLKCGSMGRRASARMRYALQ